MEAGLCQRGPLCLTVELKSPEILWPRESRYLGLVPQDPELPGGMAGEFY